MVTPTPLRVVFFGTPMFAVPSLEALLQSSHAVVGVVTRPDRPRGRGHRTSDTPVKTRALAAGVPVLQPDRMNDPFFLHALAGLRADLGVVAAYGKVLGDAALAATRLGLINVHASLLPRYRGAAPVHRAIINGETETGVTIMRMVKALDAGPMLAAVRRTIGPDDTSDEVERDLARLGAPLLVSIVDALSSGPVTEAPQDDSAATYAHRIVRGAGAIDWRMSAAAIHNLIRGLHPWPHAFTYHPGQRLILLRSAPERTAEPDSALHTPGTVVEADGDRLCIATGHGVLAVAELQAEGRRPMTARAFLAGTPLAPGDVLTNEP
jgi:methionyl-tRNA formyltransferase